MSGRHLVWGGGAIVVLAASGLAAYLGVAGLSSGSEVAGVGGGFVGLAGLAVAVYGVFQAHKDAVSPDPGGRGGGQSVTNTTAHTIIQVKDITGTLHVGKPSSLAPPASPARPTTRPSAARPAPPEAAGIGGQRVSDSIIGRNVTQVDSISGDVDIDGLINPLHDKSLPRDL